MHKLCQGCFSLLRAGQRPSLIIKVPLSIHTSSTGCQDLNVVGIKVDKLGESDFVGIESLIH